MTLITELKRWVVLPTISRNPLCRSALLIDRISLTVEPESKFKTIEKELSLALRLDNIKLSPNLLIFLSKRELN